MYRLHDRDETRRRGVGISCDKEGAYFGEYPLVAPETVEGRTCYRVRPAAEINSVLTAGFGVPFDLGPSYAALERVAKSLNEGDVGRAQVVALQIRFPELVGDEATRRLRKASRLMRFNPNHYPKGPRGGQFAPRSAGAGDEAPVLVPAGPRTPGIDANPGVPVKLPNGGQIRDPNSPTGFLMSPVESLEDVARAGRQAGAKYHQIYSDSALLGQGAQYSSAVGGSFGDLFGEMASNVATGGKFDYQRSGSFSSGFTQKPQFRDVSNFNVGLFMQQTGLFSLEETLGISGSFALLFSSNRRLNRPYWLDKRTADWIAAGYRAGASGAFGPRERH